MAGLVFAHGPDLDRRVQRRCGLFSGWRGHSVRQWDDLASRRAAAAATQVEAGVGNPRLQPGIRLTVDKGTSILVPYTICLANGCVAATVPEPKLLSELETGRILSLEAVNSNVVTVIASLSLDNFASARQGLAAQVFEQKLEGNWERPTDAGSRK